VVVIREVLEHVAGPAVVIANIRSCLRPGGLAVATESFARVEPEFPTHLAANARFAGATPRMFVETGFSVERIDADGRPLVFRKVSEDDLTRFRSLPAEGWRGRGRRLLRGGRSV
jgi:SAM-dependent methyltransferase